MTWILPALLAPLLFAIVVLIDDNLVRFVYKGAHIGAVISGFFGLAPAILILLWQGYESIPANLIALSLIAGFINVIYYYFYFRGLEVEHPSIVIALFSLTPAIVPFIAYFVVNERLSFNQILGFGIVILSALIYSLTDVRRLKFSKALITVLIAALIFDLVAIINKYVYSKADFYDAYLYFSLGMFLGGLYFFYSLIFAAGKVKFAKLLKRNSILLLLILALAEVINITAEYVRNYALGHGGPVSLVQAISNIQPLYILVISLLLYPLFPRYFPEAKARHMRLKFFLCFCLMFGVFLTVK